jgi:sensor domain CHASE-containing protein
MIKVFRKIRQNMIKENRTSKYLLYAIGEIILVVIGILIALSINNWNEQRKERQIEQSILKEIRNNLTFRF